MIGDKVTAGSTDGVHNVGLVAPGAISGVEFVDANGNMPTAHQNVGIISFRYYPF